MLIHHFGAETQGFQGLVNQIDRGKAYVPEKSHCLKEPLFVFGFRTKARSSPMPIVRETIFIFDVPSRANQLFVKYIEIY